MTKTVKENNHKQYLFDGIKIKHGESKNYDLIMEFGNGKYAKLEIM